MLPNNRKILFIATTTTAGGIDSASTRLAAELLKRGSNLTYVTASYGAIYQHCVDFGIPNASLSTKNSGDVSSIFQVAALVRQYQPDIVHVHSRRDYVTAALGARLGGRSLERKPKIILHLHLHKVMGEPPRPAGWFFQRVADKAIAVSDAVRQFVTDTHHLRPEYVETIYNGLDSGEYFAPGAEEYSRARIKQRASWGLSDDDQVIGMLGRFSVKGQHRMIEALPDILRVLPRVKLVLIGADNGNDTDRPELNYAEAAKAAGVSEQVIVTGLTDGVTPMLPSLDLLVHLPVNEAFGLALVEAMASGIPVITSDIPGCREVINLTNGGIVIEPSDRDALFANLKKMFDPIDGPEMRLRYGSQGRTAVIEQFDMQEHVRQIEDLYDRLAGPVPQPDAVQLGK